MNKRKMRAYDKEFKLNAVKLYLESGQTYKKMSEDARVPSATLVGWVEDHNKAGSDAFAGKGHVKPSEVEMTQLRKELAIVKEERDILKNGQNGTPFPVG